MMSEMRSRSQRGVGVGVGLGRDQGVVPGAQVGPPTRPILPRPTLAVRLQEAGVGLGHGAIHGAGAGQGATHGVGATQEVEVTREAGATRATQVTHPATRAVVVILAAAATHAVARHALLLQGDTQYAHVDPYRTLAHRQQNAPGEATPLLVLDPDLDPTPIHLLPHDHHPGADPDAESAHLRHQLVDDALHPIQDHPQHPVDEDEGVHRRTPALPLRIVGRVE